MPDLLDRLEEARQAVNDALDLAKAIVQDVRHAHETALAEAIGQRNEARHQLAALLEQVLAAKLESVQPKLPAAPTYGRRVCRSCGNPFERLTRRQERCEACKYLKFVDVNTRRREEPCPPTDSIQTP